jgi:AcrR family transcriptional regulator
MSNQKRGQSSSSDEPPGLRERKKRETRLAISGVATRLFIERGFENVTVAEVAQVANVSVNTVFNYFSTKEELFFDRGPELTAAPSRVVRERHRGESAVAALRRAFRKAVKAETSLLLGPRLKPFVATIEASPALLARERLLLEESEAQLAATLAEESGVAPEDPSARAVAALITAVVSLLLRELRRGILAEEQEEPLRLALNKLGERGFELLMLAAGDYCVRASDTSG